MDVAKFSASFCHQSVDHPVCKSLVGTYNRVCNSKYEPTSMNDFMRSVKHLIGASLSEPHTSVTALRTHVYVGLSIYGPTTYRKF